MNHIYIQVALLVSAFIGLAVNVGAGYCIKELRQAQLLVSVKGMLMFGGIHMLLINICYMAVLAYFGMYMTLAFIVGALCFLVINRLVILPAIERHSH